MSRCAPCSSWLEAPFRFIKVPLEWAHLVLLHRTHSQAKWHKSALQRLLEMHSGTCSQMTSSCKCPNSAGKRNTNRLRDAKGHIQRVNSASGQRPWLDANVPSLKIKFCSLRFRVWEVSGWRRTAKTHFSRGLFSFCYLIIRFMTHFCSRPNQSRAPHFITLLPRPCLGTSAVTRFLRRLVKTINNDVIHGKALESEFCSLLDNKYEN